MWRLGRVPWAELRRHPGGTRAAAQSERPDLLGRPELDGQAAVDRRPGMARGGRRARRGGARLEPAIRARLRERVGQSLRRRWRPRRSKATGFTFNLGVLLLLVCGVALMYGSIGEWIHVSGNVGRRPTCTHPSTASTPGSPHLITVNGWVTFIGGILLVIFACFEMTSEEIQLAILTTVIAAVTLIFAIYDMFRIVQKISQVPASAECRHQRRLGPDLRAQCGGPGHAGRHSRGCCSTEIAGQPDATNGRPQRCCGSDRSSVRSLAVSLTAGDPRRAGRSPCGSVRSCRSTRS